MEEVFANIVRELPSTGILILFVWFVGKQFDVALRLLSEHLEQLNKLISNCLEGKQREGDKEIRIDSRLDKIEDILISLQAVRSST